jgi:hypothetical protein
VRHVLRVHVLHPRQQLAEEEARLRLGEALRRCGGYAREKLTACALLFPDVR